MARTATDYFGSLPAASGGMDVDDTMPVLEDGVLVAATLGVIEGTAGVWLPPGALQSWQGTPYRGNVGYSDAWFCQTAADSALASTVILPAGWLTFHVDVYWAITISGTGSAAWSSYMGSLVDGTDAGVFPELIGGSGSVTPAAVNTVKVTRTSSSVHTNVAGAPFTVLVQRPGASQPLADDFTQDAALLGVKFTRAT